MSLSKDVEVLRSIPLFAKIEPAKLKLLAFTSERLSFMSGDELCRQGDVGDAAYIILNGDADVMVNTPAGPVRVASVGRNDIIGEIAILCDVPRTATVVARADLETLRISKDHFFQMVKQFPQIGLEVMHELASRLHHTTQSLSAAKARLNQLEKVVDGDAS
ncbi:MAG TPA: cyclic nucleotide-binding domain-containing protein [Geminicoccaceae bacterium]